MEFGLSYNRLHATAAHESANPNLWDGLGAAYVPAFGHRRLSFKDISGYSRDAPIVSGEKVVWDARGLGYETGAPAGGANGWNVDASWLDTSKPFCVVTGLYVFAKSGTANIACGVGRWASLENLLLARFNAASLNDIRHIVATDGTNFDNTLSVGAKVGGNLIAIQYRQSDHTGQQYVNGRLFETAEGTGNVVSFSRLDLCSYSSSSQLQIPITSGVMTVGLIYDRWLKRSELDLLYRDPLAPFRPKKKAIFVVPSGQTGSVSEALALSDAAFNVLATTQTASDTLTLADATSNVIATAQAVADSLVLTDATTATVTGPGTETGAADDAITLTDTTSVQLASVQVLSESLSLADATAGVMATAQTVSESLTLTDAVTGVVGLTPAAASDTLTLTDSTSVLAALVASGAESLSITDSVSATLATSETISETLSFSVTASVTSSADQAATFIKVQSATIGVAKATGTIIA